MDLQSTNDKDLRLLLGKITDVAEYLFSRYQIERENYPEFEQNDNKLNRSEEDGNYNLYQIILKLLDIENIYMEQKVDTNQNSECGPDDDIETGLNVNKTLFYKYLKYSIKNLVFLKVN